jgi:hypothetical protein
MRVGTVITDYGQSWASDVLTGLASVPATFYVALCTGMPDRSVDGTSLQAGVEVKTTGGTSYARAAVASGATKWVSTGAGTSNLDQITFPTPTAPWGIVSHFAICTAATGGQVLFATSLPLERFVDTGLIVIFEAGVITWMVKSPTETIVQ